MTGIDKLWPDYFDRFELPSGAHEEEILVYRACKTMKCEKASFLPTYEEQGYKALEDDDECDPGLYSLSTFEKAKDVKRFAILNSETRPPYKIAKGYTRSIHGLVQRTRERTKRKTSHVDWWLYKDSKPWQEFEIIDNFENYLENIKK